MKTQLDAAITIALGLSLSINALFAYRQFAPPREEAALRAGDPAPVFEAKDEQGQAARVDFAASGRPTLLYIFSSTCGWCERNRESIRALAAQAGPRYRIAGVSITHERPGVHGLPFPVLWDPSDATHRAYRLGATPATLLISPAGRVLKVWTGAWRGAMKTEIESEIGVRLPEI